MCDCGKEILASSNSLRTGHVLSCGCLRLERLSKAVSKVNKYDLSGEYGIGYTSNTNAKFYFDLEDYDKIKGYCWHEDNDGYIVTATRTLNNKNPIYKYPKLHILVMLPNGKKDFVQVDHKNRNKKDNRKKQFKSMYFKR